MDRPRRQQPRPGGARTTQKGGKRMSPTGADASSTPNTSTVSCPLVGSMIQGSSVTAVCWAVPATEPGQ
jgi:hypothetical protein